MTVIPPELPALSSIFRPSATARAQGAAVIVLVTVVAALAVGSVTLLILRNAMATRPTRSRSSRRRSSR